MPGRFGARRLPFGQVFRGLDIDLVRNRWALNGRYRPDVTTIPGWTFARADGPGTATALTPEGTRQRFASNVARRTGLGLLVERGVSNLIQNPGAPSTQSRTVTAVAHTLSFEGTGSIALSGASTAGPLNGTGANNRVSLTFTPTAGSLTMTVTGDVRDAQLEALPRATSPVLDAVAATGVRGIEFPYVTGLEGLFAGGWTIVAEVASIVGYSGGVPVPFSVSNDAGGSNGGANNRLLIYRSGTAFVALVNRGGSNVTGSAPAPVNALSGPIRMAMSYDGAQLQWAANGLAGNTLVATGSLTGALNRLDIGRGSGDGTSGLNDLISRLRVLPGAADTAGCQALTA